MSQNHFQLLILVLALCLPGRSFAETISCKSDQGELQISVEESIPPSNEDLPSYSDQGGHLTISANVNDDSFKDVKLNHAGGMGSEGENQYNWDDSSKSTNWQPNLKLEVDTDSNDNSIGIAFFARFPNRDKLYFSGEECVNKTTKDPGSDIFKYIKRE